MHTSQEGFVLFTRQSSEQLLHGAHRRQECDRHPVRLPGIDTLAEEKGNRYFTGDGEAAWPGGISAGQGLYQREGEPAEGSKQVGCTVTRKDPHQTKSLCKGPETGRDKACWRKGAGHHKAL